MTPISGSDCNQPYHLHPQDGQFSSITTQCYHSNGLLHSSPKSNSSHSCRDRNTREQTKDQPKNGCPHVDANIERSLEMTEHTEAVHPMNLKEYQICNRKDLQHISPRLFPTSPTTESSQIRLKKKRHTHTEDLVERNKKTLGHSTSGNGSYADVHALQQKNPRIGKKVFGDEKLFNCHSFITLHIIKILAAIAYLAATGPDLKINKYNNNKNK